MRSGDVFRCRMQYSKKLTVRRIVLWREEEGGLSPFLIHHRCRGGPPSPRGKAFAQNHDGEGIDMERNSNLRTNSQSLRKNLTKEENLLWYNFLRKYPFQFRRQFVIGNYIVDFYCHKAKLVIELDGSQHCTPKEMAKDTVRTEYLQSQGLLVLRIPNNAVAQNFTGVCEHIDNTVKQRIP